MIAALLRALRALVARIRRPRPTATPAAPALCEPGAARREATAPTEDEARGEVFAALVADPRAPWVIVCVVPLRAPWKPMWRAEPLGPRLVPFATRWGDA